MTTVTVARKDRWKMQYPGWYHFVVYDFGDRTLTARLFDTRKGADYFIERRVKHPPLHRGRVKFK